jgi:hypothetical protein
MQLILGTKYLNGYNTGSRYNGTLGGHVFYSTAYADDRDMLAIVPQLT